MASMYAVYHGPEGLTHIAKTVHRRAAVLAAGLKKLGFAPRSEAFFDTVTVDAGANKDEIIARALAEKINLRIGDTTLGIALDETTTPAIVEAVWRAFGGALVYAEIEAGVRDGAAGRAETRYRRSSPIRYFTPIARRPSCCATCENSPTAIWRSTAP